MAAPQSEGGGRLRRELGLVDVVLFNVAAILGLRWLSTAAASGPSSLVVWALAFLFFFVPQALTVIELSTRYPQEGGIYRWTQRAFGDFHGFVAGWCYWVSNLIYFPTLLIFAAGTAAFIGGEKTAWLGDQRWFMAAFAFGALWLALGLNLVGLRVGKWLQNFGAVGNWVPGLVLLGAWAFIRFGSATEIRLGDLVPVFSTDTAAFWATLCFAFAGLELAPLMAEEIRDPRRNLPRAILISGGLITFIYVLGTAALLVALPASDVNIISGVAQAVAAVSERLGQGWLIGVVALLVSLAAIGGVGAWFTGAARIPHVAGIDRYLPEAMGRIHPRWGTPHVSLLTQGVLASLFLVLGLVGAAVQETYQTMVTMTLIVYYVPFLYMFLALPVLRWRDRATLSEPGTVLIPGGWGVAWLVSGLGLVTTALSIWFSLIPSQVVENHLWFLIKVIGGCSLFVGSGAAIFLLRRPRARPAPASRP